MPRGRHDTARPGEGSTHSQEIVHMSKVWRPVHTARRPIIYQSNIVNVHAGFTSIGPVPSVDIIVSQIVQPLNIGPCDSLDNVRVPNSTHHTITRIDVDGVLALVLSQHLYRLIAPDQRTLQFCRSLPPISILLSPNGCGKLTAEPRVMRFF